LGVLVVAWLRDARVVSYGVARFVVAILGIYVDVGTIGVTTLCFTRLGVA
jgi:hypothetical protein